MTENEFNEIREALNTAHVEIRELRGSLQFLTVQWVLIVMFAGVIGIGTWHGMIVHRQIDVDTDRAKKLVRQNELLEIQNKHLKELSDIIRTNNGLLEK